MWHGSTCSTMASVCKVTAHLTVSVSVVHDKPDHLAVHVLCCPLEGSLCITLSSCTDRCRNIYCSAMYVYVCTHCSIVQAHNWVWRGYLQQWYEFTTTNGAAWALMYINITITAKGAEISELDSWEDVLSCEIQLHKSIKAKQLLLAIHFNARVN